MNSSEHFDHRCFTSTVLTKHNNNLRSVEDALRDAKLETTKCLRHVWVMIVQVLKSLLLFDLFASKFTLVILSILFGRDTESELVITESQLLGWNVTSEEHIDTLTHGERHTYYTVSTWCSV